MLPYKWSVPTAPPTWEKRLEVSQAVRTLAAQDAEQLRRRRADIAALRRDFEALRRDCSLLAQTLRQTCREQVLIELRAELRKYSPDQPRVPAGHPDGGQWTSGQETDASGQSNDGATSSSTLRPMQYAALDAGTRTDATSVDGTSETSDVESNNHGVVLAADDGLVRPRGLIIAPGPASLDPAGLNTPLSPDEQQKIADALSLIFSGDVGALNGHSYDNRPHPETGAILPPASDFGYVAFDVPGLGTGRGPRGENRLVIDFGSGGIYYTNHHYANFYPVDLVTSGN